MRDRRDLRGHWWLPGNKEDRTVGGILSHHPNDELELDVFDSLAESEPNSFGIREGNEPPVVNRVFGITDNGDRVTLDTCVQTFEKVAYGSDVIRPQTFSVSTAIIGEHFQDDISFDSVGMKVEALHRWFSRSGLNLDFDSDPNRRECDDEAESTDSGPVVRADYTYPDRETVLSDEITIYFDPGVTVQRTEISSVELSETTSVEVSPTSNDGRISLPRGKSILRKIQLFISLGLQEPIQPIEIMGYLQSEATQPKASVEILTNSSAEDTVSENPHQQGVLFLLPDIEETFEPLLGAWIRSFNELSPVLNIYFDTIYANPNPMTMYLLRRAILEVYYRTRISTDQPSRPSFERTNLEESQANYDTIMALLEEETEKPFSAQLEEILELHSNTISKASDQLADRISESHSSLESLFKGAQNSSSALHRRSESLNIICNIVILSEIGLSPDRIAAFVETT